MFAVFDEEYTVFGVFVFLLCGELCDSFGDRRCDAAPVFGLYGGVVDAVDVADVVLSSCSEHPAHRFAEHLGEACGEFTFGAVAFSLVLVRHPPRLPRVRSFCS